MRAAHPLDEWLEDQVGPSTEERNRGRHGTVWLPTYVEHRYIARVQEPTFLVLAALAAEPLHGYGIIQAVGELSDGAVRLRPGTLYPALDRLTADELVEMEREEVVDGRLRRYYRLTDEGAGRLQAEVERMRRNAEAAAARLAARSATAADPAPAGRPARPASRRPRGSGMSLEHSYRRLLSSLSTVLSRASRRRDHRDPHGRRVAGPRRPDRLASARSDPRRRAGAARSAQPDGLAAGAALAAPVCLTLAAADALAALLEGPRSTAEVVVAAAWMLAVAGRALAPRWGGVMVLLALVTTGGAMATGQPYELWRVAGWGLAAVLGDLSPLARSTSRSPGPTARRPDRRGGAGRCHPLVAGLPADNLDHRLRRWCPDLARCDRRPDRARSHGRRRGSRGSSPPRPHRLGGVRRRWRPGG